MEKNENGYSNFLFGNRNRTVNQNRNGQCPGTGDIWRGNDEANRNNIGGNTNNNMYGNMNDMNDTNGMNGNRENMDSGMNHGMGWNNASRNGGCNGGMSSNCAQRQLAMVYSPYQCWRMLYSPDEALNHGCLFEELNKPLEEY